SSATRRAIRSTSASESATGAPEPAGSAVSRVSGAATARGTGRSAYDSASASGSNSASRTLASTSGGADTASDSRVNRLVANALKRSASSPPLRGTPHNPEGASAG